MYVMTSSLFSYPTTPINTTPLSQHQLPVILAGRVAAISQAQLDTAHVCRIRDSGDQ